jgi:diphthamide biosynthesis protein 4
LVYDEDKNIWSRGCRCGDSNGYMLTEAELERESSEGEIYVACKGCSLWIKVLFGTTESD